MKTFRQHISERRVDALRLATKLEGQPSADEFLWAMKEMGADEIGSGFFSVVYARPDDKDKFGIDETEFVVKVGKSGGDKAYAAYAAYAALNHSKNSFLPKILKTIPLSDSGGSSREATILEYVTVLDDYCAEKFSPNGRFAVAGRTSYLIDLIISGRDTSDVQEYLKGLSPEAYQWAQKEIIEKAELLQKLRPIFDHPTVRMIDIKPANLGVRKNGEIVLLDPVA